VRFGRAVWHLTVKVCILYGIMPIFPPEYAPELNPVENILGKICAESSSQ
jgi:transposase